MSLLTNAILTQDAILVQMHQEIKHPFGLDLQIEGGKALENDIHVCMRDLYTYGCTDESA